MITATAAMREDRQQDEAAMSGCSGSRPTRRRRLADDAGEDDEADAVADARSVISSPIHMSVTDRAGGEGDDLGDRLEAAEVERRRRTFAFRSARKP
jgi:hypothetical protein